MEQTQEIPTTDLDMVRLLAALAPSGAVVDRQDLLQELGRTGMDPDRVLASLDRLGVAGLVAVSELVGPTGGRLQVAVIESALADLDPTEPGSA